MGNFPLKDLLGSILEGSIGSLRPIESRRDYAKDDLDGIGQIEPRLAG